MKKHLLKISLALCALVMGAAQGWAETEVVKSWDFAVIGSNHANRTTFISLSDGTIKAGNTACDLGTGDLAGLFAQGGDKWLIYSNGSLYNGNGGGRILGMTNLKAGDIVTIKTDGEYYTGIQNATYTYADNTYTLTVTEDGMVYGSSDPRYHYIYSITVEREKSSKPFEPVGTITAVNGSKRVVSLATESLGCEIYYTTDGTDPTTSSELYTETGVEISETTTIKAIAVLAGVPSDVYTAEFEAGTEVSLAIPTFFVTGITEAEDVYNATYNASVDNSAVLCKPTASLSAAFNGEAVELPFKATADGKLVITASSEGYNASSLEINVAGKYTKSVSHDFKNMVAADFDVEKWGEPQTGMLGSTSQWGSTIGGMNDETVHYTVQNDEALATVFDGLTLGYQKKGEDVVLPSIYLGYGLIFTSTNTNYGFITVTSGPDSGIIEVALNGGYGKNKRTEYSVGSSVNIYRYDTAVETIAAYAPKVEGTDAINTIAATSTNAAIFNLAGQKVDAGFKGIVVKNGKKVVIK